MSCRFSKFLSVFYLPRPVAFKFKYILRWRITEKHVKSATSNYRKVQWSVHGIPWGQFISVGQLEGH